MSPVETAGALGETGQLSLGADAQSEEAKETEGGRSQGLQARLRVQRDSYPRERTTAVDTLLRSPVKALDRENGPAQLRAQVGCDVFHRHLRLDAVQNGLEAPLRCLRRPREANRRRGKNGGTRVSEEGFNSLASDAEGVATGVPEKGDRPDLRDQVVWVRGLERGGESTCSPQLGGQVGEDHRGELARASWR